MDAITQKVQLAIENIGRIESLPDTSDKKCVIDNLMEGLFDSRLELQLAMSELTGKSSEVERAIESADILWSKLRKNEYKPVINLVISEASQLRMYRDILEEYGITTTNELFDAMTNEYPVHDELFSKLKRIDTVFLSSKLIELNYKFPE